MQRNPRQQQEATVSSFAAGMMSPTASRAAVTEGGWGCDTRASGATRAAWRPAPGASNKSYCWAVGCGSLGCRSVRAAPERLVRASASSQGGGMGE